MPLEGFQAQPCPTGANQAQPQAMQGIQMSPWSVQDSQAQLQMAQGYQAQPLSAQGYQAQPLSAQGYQAQPLPAQGCPAQLQGILTGKSDCKADLLNRALADLLEPETPVISMRQSFLVACLACLLLKVILLNQTAKASNSATCCSSLDSTDPRYM